jgi:MFS transporter, YNFM family, putative membrane transport protein
MRDHSHLRLQLIVSALVAASFTNIYITQPILPVLRDEFSTDTVRVSFTISAVILGIAMSNLPFGVLADRLPIHPIILTGGVLVASAGLVCALTTSLWLLISARFVQGLFIPALTTCLAAYLARTIPAVRLNVVMGSYVSATVLGGLGGRLLGGWIHPPLHWRYAFVSASVLLLVTTFVALRGLPRSSVETGRSSDSVRFRELLTRWELVRIYLCAAGSFSLFSSVFNYLPFRLTGSPFNFSTQLTTLLYLSYIVGIFMGPTAGRISNRYGSGNALLAGSIVLGSALALIGLPSILAVVVGLLAICAGFFTVHAAAVGSLNRRLSIGQGRANALYVLFYYVGGWVGITGSGFAYTHGGWGAVISICALLLLIPLSVGIAERETNRRRASVT